MPKKNLEVPKRPVQLRMPETMAEALERVAGKGVIGTSVPEVVMFILGDWLMKNRETWLLQSGGILPTEEPKGRGGKS